MYNQKYHLSVSLSYCIKSLKTMHIADGDYRRGEIVNFKGLFDYKFLVKDNFCTISFENLTEPFY